MNRPNAACAAQSAYDSAHQAASNGLLISECIAKSHRRKHIPRVAGLQTDYLIAQLRGFKTGARADIDGTMASAAQPLSEKDIVDVAAYLASLK